MRDHPTDPGPPIRYDDAEARAVLDRMGDAFFVFDAEWRLLFMNPAAERVVERRAGRPARELLGRDVWRTVPSLQGTAVPTEFQRAMETGTAARFMTSLPRSGATLEVDAYPTPDRLYVFARDVTERVRAESQLRALLEGARDVIALLDDEGTIQYVNGAMRECLGYEPAEVVGTNALELVFPEDLPRLAARIARALAADPSAGDAAVEPLEFRVRTKAGELRTHEALARPIEQPGGGSFPQLLVVSRDVTAQRRAEAMIREDESYFRVLVDSIDFAAVGMLSPFGQIVSWNAGSRRLYGYEEAEVLGRPYATLFTETDVEAGRPDALLEEARRSGSVEADVERRRKSGPPVPAHVKITALHGDDGHLIGFAAISTAPGAG